MHHLTRRLIEIRLLPVVRSDEVYRSFDLLIIALSAGSRRHFSPGNSDEVEPAGGQHRRNHLPSRNIFESP
jgi:hypothetical protein